MSALEIRAIVYGVIMALLVALGVRLGMHHVQAQWNVDKLAQAAALAKSQSDLTAALAERVQLQQTVAKQNDDLKASSDALVAAVSNSLRNVTDTLHADAMPRAMASAGGSIGTAAKPGRDIELESAIDSVSDAITKASSACLHDARELADILASAPNATSDPLPPK